MTFLEPKQRALASLRPQDPDSSTLTLSGVTLVDPSRGALLNGGFQKVAIENLTVDEICLCQIVDYLLSDLDDLGVRVGDLGEAEARSSMERLRESAENSTFCRPYPGADVRRPGEVIRHPEELVCHSHTNPHFFSDLFRFALWINLVLASITPPLASIAPPLASVAPPLASIAPPLASSPSLSSASSPSSSPSAYSSTSGTSMSWSSVSFTDTNKLSYFSHRVIQMKYKILRQMKVVGAPGDNAQDGIKTYKQTLVSFDLQNVQVVATRTYIMKLLIHNSFVFVHQVIPRQPSVFLIDSQPDVVRSSLQKVKRPQSIFQRFRASLAPSIEEDEERTENVKALDEIERSTRAMIRNIQEEEEKEKSQVFESVDLEDTGSVIIRDDADV